MTTSFNSDPIGHVLCGVDTALPAVRLYYLCSAVFIFQGSEKRHLKCFMIYVKMSRHFLKVCGEVECFVLVI